MKKPQVLIGLLAALGVSVGVMVAVIGLPYGRSNYSAFAELYHGATDTTGKWHLAIDCEAAAGTQDGSVPGDCEEQLPTTYVDVDATLANSTGAAVKLATFNFTMVNDLEIARLVPRVNGLALPNIPAACDGAGLDCNPDFSQATITGTFSCAGPSPIADDLSEAPLGTASVISCANGSGDGPILPGDASHITIATVHYRIPGTATAGLVPLTFKDVNVFDDTFSEVMSCNPIVSLAGDCFGAEIELLEPIPATATSTPTDTPTNTSTPTDTPTNTPVPCILCPTPVPAGPEVNKSPEGNANNVGPGPSANLWLCEPDDHVQNAGPCDGPGEGDLVVTEEASNVNAGLGAYEFQVEFDKDVIASLNPCDVVFSPGGAGAVNRGNAEQVSPLSVNCANAPLPIGGTCAMSLMFENLIRFGCVTTGQNAGPTGAFTLARLTLIPQEDLSKDIFPGNNNGVVTIIKDNGCELVDILGHAVPGSKNGGLADVCGNLSVTVRILEGDINLDCEVNLDDEQAIALHYGSFFGSTLYSKWLDLEPALHDFDIDIKDLQKVFGRDGSNCQDPKPAQPPIQY